MSILSRHPGFHAPSQAVEARVEQFLSELTLEEKIRLIGGHRDQGSTLDVPRLGIPCFKMADGPVGVHWWTDKSTAYPASIAIAASWDAELAYRGGEAIGRDARARGIHILLAPGVNLYRSPLCGRNFEYLGEDPQLAGVLGSAWIRGLQDQGVSATVKHYALNFQEYDRHRVSSDADERTLRELYLRAFEMAVEAGTGCVMTAYNLVNGLHCSEHPWLIGTVLKGEWGFQGVVMSDWYSCYNAVGQVNAGLDLEMPWAKQMTAEQLLPALRNGLITEAAIDDKVRRLLRLAVCFGWFDREQKDEAIPYRDPATEAAALEMERRGAVLLKNEAQMLPLKPGIVKKVVVLGSQAVQPPTCGGGSAYTPPHSVRNLVESITELAGSEIEVAHFPALDIHRFQHVPQESVFCTPSGQPGLLGEYFPNKTCSGVPILTRTDAQLNFWWGEKDPVAPGIDRESFSIRWTGTIQPKRSGTHVFYIRSMDGGCRLFVEDRSVLDSSIHPLSRLMTVRCELEAGKTYPIRLEFSVIGAWIGFFFGWEHADAALVDYARALDAARNADAVVVTAGFIPETEGEGYDRDFTLDAAQQQLLLDAASANPNTAVVLFTGGAIECGPWFESARAVIEAWYPGQEGSFAIAEILLGIVNPSGRLPFTWERRLQDRGSVNCYHDSDGDKRVQVRDGVFHGYRHFDREEIEPQFPFGFGLSYTTFELGELSVSVEREGQGGRIVASVLVKNTGEVAGRAVVQFYIGDLESSVPRPVRELAAFASVELQPGAEQVIEAEIPERTLRFWSLERGGWVIEPGEFVVWAGFHSQDLQVEKRFLWSEGLV